MKIIDRISPIVYEKPLDSSEIRNTMGLFNPSTGERYKDIISAHLQLRRLTLEEWLEHKKIAESRDRHKLYYILLDHNTRKKLIQEKTIDVLVSFQVRTNGCYAVCRVFDKEKQSREIS